MPFWKKRDSTGDAVGNGGDNGNNGAEKVNYKARLEHKQYLAQESPEPVYDLASCALKAVPSGVYSKCKVLRKEALLLQDNELTNLTTGGSIADMAENLQVLDLSTNHLEKLPDEIGMLRNLRVLYVHRNRLKKLPESVGKLRRLQSLDVSRNALKELPWAALGSLRALKSLDLQGNPKLARLGKELSGARRMEKLGVDADALKAPPPAVCNNGTEAIMRALCKENGVDYIAPGDYQPTAEELAADGGGGGGHRNGSSSSSNGLDDDPYDRLVRGNLKRIDEQKESKMREMLAMQKALEADQEKELQLAASVMNEKKKLLNDLAQQEAKREEDVRKLQQLKDKEREALFKSLNSAENRTDALIDELMKHSAKSCDPQKVLEELERERREMEEMFTVKAGEEEKLRQEEVKREMQRMIAEELKREQVRSQYEAGKKNVVDDALSNDLKNSAAVSAVLASKGRQQEELIGNLLEDERYQREAFSSLLLRQDQRHKQISSQVEQVQAELASLTMVEMTKKDLRVEFEREAMAEKRETLTGLLMELMKQREERAVELQSRLREMEENRSRETDNYWLIQYQKLLDSKPKGLVEAEAKLDSDLVAVLKEAAAEEYGPVFALRGVTGLKQLSYMKDKELSEMGVHNTYLRQKILLCAERAAAEQERRVVSATAGDGVPSAPPMPSTAPSAPPPPAEEGKSVGGDDPAPRPSAPPVQHVETFQSTECVVCMENKCDVLFLPCGHVCVCFGCDSSPSAAVGDCPLCRAKVAQRVRLR